MEQLSLLDELTDDEQEMLNILHWWVPSGRGGMQFSTLWHQTGWKLKRAIAAHDGLIGKGIIIQAGPCNEWFIKEYYEKGI